MELVTPWVLYNCGITQSGLCKTACIGWLTLMGRFHQHHSAQLISLLTSLLVSPIPAWNHSGKGKKASQVVQEESPHNTAYRRLWQCWTSHSLWKLNQDLNNSLSCSQIQAVFKHRTCGWQCKPLPRIHNPLIISHILEMWLKGC